MRTRIIAVTVDCHDTEALAAFWGEALGSGEFTRWNDAHGLGYVELQLDGHPPLLFQPVCVLPRR